MSALIPAIDRWEAEGWKWQYVLQPKIGPFTIPPKGRVDIPERNKIYNAEEGVIINFNAVFDHPKCGFNWKFGPEADLGDIFTVENIAIGTVPPEPLVYVMMPPRIPFYELRVPSPWKWEKTFQMEVFNADVAPHLCLAYGYYMATTKKKKS